jgi:hypothetical protein
MEAVVFSFPERGRRRWDNKLITSPEAGARITVSSHSETTLHPDLRAQDLSQRNLAIIGKSPVGTRGDGHAGGGHEVAGFGPIIVDLHHGWAIIRVSLDTVVKGHMQWLDVEILCHRAYCTCILIAVSKKRRADTRFEKSIESRNPDSAAARLQLSELHWT